VTVIGDSTVRIPTYPPMDWTRAACRPVKDGEVVEDFFPDPTKSAAVQRAQRVCQDCPIRTSCYQFAKVTGQGHGVWGGVLFSKGGAA
jgi:hypothetical protein